MTRKFNFQVVAISLLVALTTSYVLCIAACSLFDWAMYEIWAPLLPGFVWPITAGGFIIGLLWLAIYSLYIPAIFVLPYNFLIQRASGAAKS